MFRHSGPFRRQDDGAALVEFALALPLLCIIIIGTIDFGRVFYMAIALENAARAGAQYGAQSLAKTTDTAGMQTAALNSASADIGSFTAFSAGRTCECDGVVFVCPPTGTCGGTTRVYVTVTANKVFSMISGYPGFSRTISVTRAASMRAK